MEYSYNTVTHSSTYYSPFKAVNGRDTLPLIRGTIVHTGVNNIKEQMIERGAMLEELRYKILCAQQRMKLQEDKRRREVGFG